ncbi:unnamed protein product [Candidula unifasciata]|uniref:Uncharacterized protein n=1 Tax=Candidula unifasciata TaxID=100452 RepID=A0A8S3ZWG1_9EUPU|nr:unnamed protein product [Candidula unifasciata]
MIVLTESSVESQSHFPLKNCSGQKIDILGLVHFDPLIWREHLSSLKQLYSHVAVLTDSPPISRLRYALFIDRSTTHDVGKNYRSWRFQNIAARHTYYYDRTTNALQYRVTGVEKVVKRKIQFAELLFKQLQGVRKSAIHVAVIFLDGADLKEEDIRKVPSIVEKQNSGFKILILLYGYKFVKDTVHLHNTIVVPYVGNTGIEQTLLMALCKQCLPGWVSRVELTLGMHVHSCYRFFVHENITWSNAMTTCSAFHGGYLTRIETFDELTFVKSLLYNMTKEEAAMNNVYSHIVDVYIGLRRDLTSYAKRFHWHTDLGQHLPLVIRHWSQGAPSCGSGICDCGMWRFKSDWHQDQNNNVTYKFSDGWKDVECSEKQSMSLCEVSFQQQVDINHVFNVKAASQKSFNASLAKGDFLLFEDNIVSVYENVERKEVFESFLTTVNECPLFDCEEDTGKQRYIPYSLVCDRVDHCSNRRDEKYCFQQDVYSPTEQQCARDRRCWDGSCLPIQYFNDGELDCLINVTRSLTDENMADDVHLKDYKTCALICNIDTCINMSQLNDGVDDCKGLDSLDETIGKLPAVNACASSEGKLTWAPKCVYIKDIYGGVVGCRDMSHLSDCENFTCSQGYVKCFNSYCIPQHYLLDMKADCPTGEDEQPFNTGPCTGHFACWKSRVCLHADFVCDGHADCPHKDDELNCNTLCPEGFRCTAGTVSVILSKSLDLDSFTHIGASTRYLNLSGIDLSQTKNLFYQVKQRFPKIVALILSKCKISNIDFPENETSNQYTPFNIQSLDISYNIIHEIFNNEVFSDMLPNIKYLNASYNNRLISLKHLRFEFLEILDVSYTGLSYLHGFVFAGLPFLKHLNLSYTLISDFSRQYFPSVLTLHTLDLQGLLIDRLEADLFHGVAVSQNLYTDQYQVCCPKVRGSNISAHACKSPTEAISSCFDLIGLFFQRILLWLVAVLAFVGNTMVIVYRLIWDRSVLQRGYGLFVTNLGVSDFIMGVYLFIIAGADQFYRGNYVLYDRKWRESIACNSAGFMATLSHETSTFFTLLITLDRFLVIKYPFGQNHISRLSKIAAVICVWVTGLLLSLIPLLMNFSMYSSNAMCLGLPLTSTRGIGWEYSVGVFVFFNFIMLLFIVYGQYAIFRAISENRIPKTATNMSRLRRAEDITVAKQLSLVVLSNFVCWFPIGFMGLISLGGYYVSDEVYAWTTILLLPLNSAANPILYTIPVLMSKWEAFKNGEQIA